MKHAWLMLLLAVGSLPSQGLAMCYTVYAPNAAVIWRGTNSPIDLSRPVSVGLRALFPPGSFLVISEETYSCTPVGPGDFFGPIPGMTVDRPAR